MSSLLVLESDARDNRANIPAEWFERMEALPEAESRRYLRCCHDDFKGKVFTLFTEANICPRFPIPKSWPIVRGCDPGVTGAGWVWISAVTGLAKLRQEGWPGLPEDLRDGHTVTWHCWQPRSVPIEEVAAQVTEWDKGLTVLFTGIDPSDARQQTGRGLKTTAELLTDLNMGPIVKAPNDETAFILKANQGFVSRRDWITANCVDLIRQLRSDVWDDRAGPGVARRKYAREFHVLAAWKYARMLEPELLSAGPIPREKPKHPTRNRTGY